MNCCEEYQDLIKPIISLIKYEIDKEAKTVCYGCLYDRPGQRDHDKCLMLDPIEKLEEFFEIAWEKCQFAEILKPLIYEYMKVNITFFSLLILILIILCITYCNRRDGGKCFTPSHPFFSLPLYKHALFQKKK